MTEFLCIRGKDKGKLKSAISMNDLHYGDERFFKDDNTWMVLTDAHDAAKAFSYICHQKKCSCYEGGKSPAEYCDAEIHKCPKCTKLPCVCKKKCDDSECKKEKCGLCTCDFHEPDTKGKKDCRFENTWIFCTRHGKGANPLRYPHGDCQDIDSDTNGKKEHWGYNKSEIDEWINLINTNNYAWRKALLDLLARSSAYNPEIPGRESISYKNDLEELRIKFL